MILFNSISLSLIPTDFAGKDGSKVTTVVATPGQGPDRPQEVSYSDTKVIGNGSFGVVFQAKLCDNGELVAIKKVLQDKRFKVNINFPFYTQQITHHFNFHRSRIASYKLWDAWNTVIS